MARSTMSKRSSSMSSSDETAFTTADHWFESGRRVPYDPERKVMARTKRSNTVAVFERVVLGKALPNRHTRWTTLLPGFPDGSYGYSKVDRLLDRGIDTTPRLYLEYVGQGDSDKPRRYEYSTLERADLVEAQWAAHNVQTTVLVTFDYSSLVMLELLQRQKERAQHNIYYPRIEHVLCINGGLFADGHSHPYTTTPLLQTRVGKMGSSMAQRLNVVFDMMLKPLYSDEYRSSKLTKRELRETEKAVRRHKGTRFLSQAAGFVNEHQQQAERWDLYRILSSYAKQQGITFHIVGSQQDPFEHLQIALAQERLAEYTPGLVDIETIPGGHLSTSEQADKIAEFVHRLASKGQESTSEEELADPAVVVSSTPLESAPRVSLTVQ